MKRRRRDVGELAGCPRKMAVVGGGPSFSFTHNSILLIQMNFGLKYEI